MANNAESREDTRRPSASQSDRSESSKERACDIPPDRIPERILRRLAEVGVRTLADWRALGRHRFQIFGVTRGAAELLDELARESR